MHFHIIGNKRVGKCVGTRYVKFGRDVMRKNNTIGISRDILHELKVEGCQVIQSHELEISMLDFLLNGEVGVHEGYEPQLFVDIKHWRPINATR